MNREPGGYDPNTSNQPLQPASRVAAPSALFWFWMASGSTVAAAPAGVIVATTPGVSAIGALIAVLLGSLLAGLVLAAVSMAGVRTGSATLVLSDGVFGRRGNRVPLTVSFLVLMGWCAVMSVLLVYCVDAILRKFGIMINDAIRLLVLAVFALALVSLVWIGYRFIQATQKWISLSVGIAALAIGIATALHTDWQRALAEPWKGAIPFLGAVVIAMTGAASGWWNSGADFSRFQRPSTSRASIVRAVLGGMNGYALMVLIGCVVAYWNPGVLTADNPVAAATVAVPAWLTVAALLVITVGLHAGAVTNMYSASLNLNTFGVRNRAVSVAISASLIILIACWVLFWSDSFFNWFSSFLTALGVPVAAWAGVFIVPVLASGDWPRTTPGVIWWPLAWLVTASIVGLGLISSSTPGFAWVGYLAPGSQLAAAGIGVIIAFVVAFGGAWLTRRRWLTTAQPD